MTRIALTSFRRNPKLGQCDPKSVFAAVIMASQLGLEIGVGGQGFLVPYFDNKARRYECQFIPGWQGLVDLTARAGRASVWTGAVYEGDVFDYALGDSPFVHHKPSGKEEKLTHVYAVGRINGAQWPVVEVWPVEKIETHRDRYNKVGKIHYSFDNLEMYGRKVALLQVLKYMPKSVEMQTAIALEHASSEGAQNLTVAEAVEASWVPEEREPGDEEPEPKSGVEVTKEQLKSRKTEKPVEPRWPGDAA